MNSQFVESAKCQVGWILVLTIIVSFGTHAGILSTPLQVQSYTIVTSAYYGNGTTYYQACSNDIQLSGAPWIVVHFDSANVNLGSSSYISLTGSNGTQILDATSIIQWRYFSAMMSGSTVTVGLHVAPSDANIKLKVDEILVAPVATPADTLAQDPNNPCTIDNRDTTNVRGICRLVWYEYTTGFFQNSGTAFMTNYGQKFVTAGHVVDSALYVNAGFGLHVQFNVKSSGTDTLIAPNPSDVYVVDPFKIVLPQNLYWGCTDCGTDWAVFEVKENDSIPLTYRAGISVMQASPSYGSPIKATGYGRDPNPALFAIQQTSTGPFYGTVQGTEPGGYLVTYGAFIDHGMSGGPIIDSTSGHAIGIITAIGCPSDNLGTSFENTEFWTNLATIPSVTVNQCLQASDRGYLIHVTSTGDSVGTVELWTSSDYWDGPYSPPHTWPISSIPQTGPVVLADTLLYNGSWKFHDWDGTYYTRVADLPVQTNLVSYFHAVSLHDTIETVFPGVPANLSGGIVEFKDPWFVDTTDALHDSMATNRGTNARFWQRNSPLVPNATTKYNGYAYKGVFLNQNPQTTPVYYSVRVESTQTIDGFNAVFVGWSYDSTMVQLEQVESNPAGYDQKAVVFLQDGAVIKALYNAIVNTQVTNKYYMLSVPVGLSNYAKTSVWPTASTNAWNYIQGTGWQPKSTLAPGVGYWVKFSSAGNLQYLGAAITAETLSVTQGWNMIGSVTKPMASTKITPQCANGPWDYDNGYPHRADTIRPGQAYWMKWNQAGQVILNPNSTDSSSLPPVQDYPPSLYATLNPPSLISPANHAVGLSISPTLSWSSDSGASSYRLQVATDTSFTNLQRDSMGITSTSFGLTGLSYNSTYYWHVGAANSEGVGTWSANRSFATSPPAPSLSSPTNGATAVDTPITYQWDSAAAVQRYNLEVSNSNTFNEDSIVFHRDTIPARSYTVHSLHYSNTYYWHVSSTNSNGTSSWSSVWSFTTKNGPPATPTLSSPANNSTNVSISSAVVWNSASGATDYNLQVATDAGFNNITTNVTSTIENGILYTYWYPSLNNSTTYWWHVRSTNGSQTSSWSSAWSFTTIAQGGGGGGGGGGCCPYIYVQGDTSLNEENNILPQSEAPGNGGKDVSDYYKLLKPPTAKNGHYELELKEFEHERSFLDQLQLIAVDHPSTDSIAVSSDGSIIQYRTPFRLEDVVSGDTTLMYIFSRMDGITYGASNGKKFSLKIKQNSDAFTTFSTANQGGVLIGGWLAHGFGAVSCQPKDKVVGSASGGGASTIEGALQPFTFRERPTLVYVPVKQLKDTVMIDIGEKIQIDYLNLAIQVPDSYSTQDLELVSAAHSRQGSVTSALTNADGSYATLVPGESIRLQFTAPPLDPALTRSFILVSRGHYEHLTDASAIEKPKTFLLGQNYPNPFNPTTTMDYQLAAPGFVSVVVYNILGEGVARLVQSQQDAGYYSAAWNAVSSPSGIYYVRMTVSDQSGKQLYATTKKLVLMK